MRNTFAFVVTPKEFAKAAGHNHERSARGTPSVPSWVLLCASLGMLFFYALGRSHGRYAAVMTPVALLLALAMGALLLHLFLRYRFLRGLRYKHHFPAGVTCKVTIEELGLRINSPHRESMIRWLGWNGVDELEDLILLRVDDAHGYPLPASAFESKDEQAAFLAYVRERIRSAKGGPAAEMITPPLPTEIVTTTPEGEDGNGAISRLRRSAANAFRLTLFQRIAADRFPVTWRQVAVFGAVTLLIPLLYDVASIGTAGRFDWEAIPLAIAHIPIILLAAIVTAYALGSSDKTLFLLQAFLMIAAAIDFVVYLTYFVAVRLYPQPWPYQINIAYNVLPPIWLGLACARAAAGPLSGVVGFRTAAYVVCMIFLALPLTRMHRERSLWQAANNQLKSAEDGKRVFAEDALYSQPEILERELDAVQPGRRGVVDVYFIGMGGYANQDVFMKEVDAVSRLFRERFGSDGKSVRLVNNAKSLADSPIASVTGLRKSLQRVAAVMNDDEDILFLFLTSHGSQTHRFALDFSPLQFHELDPEKLRGLLDESGIKNRVVVLSACYSGGFIEPLKTDTSLIIAASAADKNSFGCSNEAEWTYFGKAFFDEALRKTHSFVEAFEIAKPVIAAREKEQGYTPSEPQMALGPDIKPTLLRLQQQLDAP